LPREEGSNLTLHISWSTYMIKNNHDDVTNNNNTWKVGNLGGGTWGPIFYILQPKVASLVGHKILIQIFVQYITLKSKSK